MNFSASRPGETVSTDQLVSAQPGLIPQPSGRLTSERVWAANMAVDHYSKVHKCVLMKGTSQSETLDAKLETEKFFYNHGGHYIKH